MESAQQPVQAKPAATEQVQKTPSPVQPSNTGTTIKKKPSKWWIWVIIAVVVIGGGIWAYFQFLR